MAQSALLPKQIFECSRAIILILSRKGAKKVNSIILSVNIRLQFNSRERYGQCENKNNVKTRKNNKAQIATDGKLFEVYKYHNSYFWP